MAYRNQWQNCKSMETYFGSKPKETTLSKEENVFWESDMDCGLGYSKAEGLFRKKHRDGGLRLE